MSHEAVVLAAFKLVDQWSGVPYGNGLVEDRALIGALRRAVEAVRVPEAPEAPTGSTGEGEGEGGDGPTMPPASRAAVPSVALPRRAMLVGTTSLDDGKGELMLSPEYAELQSALVAGRVARKG